MRALKVGEKKTVWTIVIDAGICCPSCEEEEMETVLLFHPKHGKVFGLTRRQLQGAGFDFWLDKSVEAYDICPDCFYIIK